MSDKRLDPFDTGFKYGKGIKTNSVKEKLTLESVVGRIQWDEVLTSNTNKDNLDKGKRLVIALLEQIREEILMNYNGITDGGKIREIDMVFNKYLISERSKNNE